MKLSSKLAAYAAIVIASATTLTACGSEDEEGDSVTTSETVARSNEAQDTEMSSEATSDTSEPDETSETNEPNDTNKTNEAAAGESEAAAAGGGARNSQERGEQNDPMVSPTPLQGGKPAPDKDRQQMERTLLATLNPPSAEKWTRVLMENSCRKVVEPFEAEMSRSGITLDQVEEAARMQAQSGQAIDLPHSEVSLTDVRIENSRASATATVTNQNGSETATQIFEREDGQWKLCN